MSLEFFTDVGRKMGRGTPWRSSFRCGIFSRSKLELEAMDSDNDREITWEEFLLFYNGVQKNKEEILIDFDPFSSSLSC